MGSVENNSQDKQENEWGRGVFFEWLTTLCIYEFYLSGHLLFQRLVLDNWCYVDWNWRSVAYGKWYLER
jgi:hypothetical protein